MASRYSITLPLSSGGTATLDSIKIDGTDYPLAGSPPIFLDSDNVTLASTVQTALNGLGFGSMFTVVQADDSLTITSICAIQEIESVSISTNQWELFSPENNGSAGGNYGVPAAINSYTFSIGGTGTPVIGEKLSVNCFGEVIEITFETVVVATEIQRWMDAYAAYVVANPSSLWILQSNFAVTLDGGGLFFTLDFQAGYTSPTITPDEEFDVEVCIAPTVTTDLTIDCDNLTCLTFKDTTRTPATGNPNGYGGGNYPAIADIVSVLFSIVDNDGIDWQYEGSGYLPTALGTNSICLKAENFISYASPIVFAIGGSYRLFYTLNLANGDSIEKHVDFIFPCCGEAISSNLGINFEVTERLGCTSFDFTDTTGVFNTVNNPNGYVTLPTSTIIRITKKDGSVVDITDFVPALASFSKNITAAALGYATNIPPQIATIEYLVYGSGNCRVGYKTMRMLFHCVLRNCIVNRGKSLLMQACATTCDNAEAKKVRELQNRYEDMLLAAEENIECIAQEIEDLYKECQKYGCC